MSIVRIDNPAAHTHGWQARWKVSARQCITRFFSDATCGGEGLARLRAEEEEPRLKRRAVKLRRAGGGR